MSAKKNTVRDNTIALLVYAIYLPVYAVAIADLWSWHLVPLGAPPANWAAILGASCALYWLKAKPEAHLFKKEVKNDDGPILPVVVRLLGILMIWGIGYALRAYAVVGGAA